MQWFAVTAPDYTLKEAMDELRPFRIDFKIGSKAHPEKLALFQACQRASRDAGEAIVDVFEELGTATWGGFAKDMKERLDTALARHGFANGLEDLFGERFHGDLLGWEHVSTGVNRQLLWDTYRRMTEFLEGTQDEGYDEQYDESYKGSEWVAGCDERCSGKACGVCSKEDLKLRQAYTKLTDRSLAERPVQRLDHATVVCRLRFRVFKPEQYRFVAAEACTDIIRRAAFRACEETGFPAIASRTVRLASDGQRFRDRSAGVDYAEFGVTRQVTGDEAMEFVGAMRAHLSPWLASIESSAFDLRVLPKDAAMPKNPPSLWELELTDHPDAVGYQLAAWAQADSVPVKIRSESLYSGVTAEDGDAKSHVRDFWLARSGHRHVLRMVLAGQLGPYQAYAALMGKASWIAAASRTAVRLAFFAGYGSPGGTLLRPACVSCGYAIPDTLLGVPYDDDYCPRCRDAAAGVLVASLAAAV
jgi:hypothetical protein